VYLRIGLLISKRQKTKLPLIQQGLGRNIGELINKQFDKEECLH
jgi:hypothetical protein